MERVNPKLLLRAGTCRVRLVRMTKYIVCSVAVAALFCVGPSRMAAQEMPGMPGMGAHYHHDEAEHGEARNRALPCLVRGEPAGSRLSAVSRCCTPSGTPRRRCNFEAIAKADPACAMAHWGIAMSQFHELGNGPRPAVKPARRRWRSEGAGCAGAKVTPREQMYIDALSAFLRSRRPTFQQRGRCLRGRR